MTNKIQPSAEAIAAFEDGIRARYRATMNTLPNKQVETPSPADKNEGKVPLEVRTPATSIDISHQEKVTAPSTIGLKAGEKIKGPTLVSLQRAEKADAERRAAELAQKDRENELVRELSPEALLNKLAATERVVKALQKKVAKLEEQGE